MICQVEINEVETNLLKKRSEAADTESFPVGEKHDISIFS
jgi:hypothetical protein